MGPNAINETNNEIKNPGPTSARERLINPIMAMTASTRITIP
jgi:hypothetical protein